MGKLQDRIAIITGAASGIGEACAELFAREGAKVIVADIQDQAGERVAKDIGGCYLHVDLTDPTQVEGVIKSAVQEYGRIDILVNNAGIEGDPGLIGDSSIENWKRVMSINIDAVYYGMKYVLPVMVEQKGGVITAAARDPHSPLKPAVAHEQTRTADRLLTMQVLYRLSYVGP